MKEGEGKEEGAETGCREGSVNQRDKQPVFQRNEGGGNPPGRGNCTNVVDARKSKEGPRKNTGSGQAWR